MLIIGLAGGIASGKSYVAACFEQLGAALVNADKVGHEVLEQSDVQSLLVRRWGTDLVKEEKSGIVVDWQKLFFVQTVTSNNWLNLRR